MLLSCFQERLAFQRQQLKQRLGLSAQGKVFSTGMENLFDDNDLVTHAVTERGEQRRESDSKVGCFSPSPLLSPSISLLHYIIIILHVHVHT